MAETERCTEFPFPDERFPASSGVTIQRTVLDGRLPAPYVAHTRDNELLVGDGLTDPNLEAASVAAHIRHIVDVDPILESLSTLPLGYQARRSPREHPLEDRAVCMARRRRSVRLGAMRKPLVMFKWEGEEQDCTPHGPVWILHFAHDSSEITRQKEFDRWFTSREARQMAEDRGYDFQEDA